jgi:hypothetical protein
MGRCGHLAVLLIRKRFLPAGRWDCRALLTHESSVPDCCNTSSVRRFSILLSRPGSPM